MIAYHVGIQHSLENNGNTDRQALFQPLFARFFRTHSVSLCTEGFVKNEK